MVEPTIVPRAAHTISRRDIDSGALKVLYQLHEHNYVAYLVGGSVRDLLLGRRPEGLRHRHVRAPASGQEALSQLLDHRAAVPAGPRQVRAQNNRGRHLPAAGGAARADAGDRSGRAPGRRRRRAGRAPPDAIEQRRRSAHRRTDRRGRASFTATTPTARPRKTRSAATSPSTRSSTTSARSRSSTTSADSRISSAG